MANLLSNPPAAQPQVPQSYTAADMRALQAETAANMLAAENQRLQQAQLYRPAAPVAPRPVGPDPLKIYADKNLTLTADENARLMDQGIRGRARQEAANAMAQVREEFRGEMNQTRQELGLQSIMAANPDIAQDTEGYAAAIGKAQYRAGNQNLDPMALANLAVQIYRSDRQRAAGQEPPFVEGAGRPAAGFGAPAPAEKPPSVYEELYGGESDDELHEERWDDRAQVLSYIDGKNDLLTKMGVDTDQSVIREVKGEALARRKRAKQRGAA